MTHPAPLGGNNFNHVIARGRVSASVARDALRRIIDEQPGPLTTAQLIARAGLNIAVIIEAFNELEYIGRKARNKPSE